MIALLIVMLLLLVVAVIVTLFILLGVVFAGGDIDTEKLWVLVAFNALLYFAVIAISIVSANPNVIALLAGQG